MAPQSSHGQASAPVQQQQSPHHRRPIRAAVARSSLLTLLVLAFTVLGAGSAFAITRDAALARGQAWIDNPVPYSQLRYYGGYRTDCSGYASMCWQTGSSYSTRTFYRVTTPIGVAQLKPGDGMLKANYPSGNHIRIFYGWVDDAHTMYVAYEQTGPTTKSSIKWLASDLANGYVPVRYDGIEDGPVSGEALRNGTFNTWASGDPVWWDSSWDGTETVAIQRKDLARAGKFSLELSNPTADAARWATVAQMATVTPETTYTLTAWARTPGDARSLELRLRYLNAAGASLSDTRTTGAAWGVGDAAFTRIAIPSVTPSGAVRALLTMRLAGGRDASGTPGNSAVLDEISLARPQATISIKTSAASTYIGRTPILSGSVTPTAAIGTNIAVWVKKPGRAYWTYSSYRTVYSLGGGAAWLYKYYFKPGMVKGTYVFKAVVPALPGHLGNATPNTVSIRLY